MRRTRRAALVLTAPGLSVIEDAIDEARRIFGRITSYTIYRVALTIDIMFLVVLATMGFAFKPLTAIMILVIALLDDVPIMSIAYDNTAVAPRPIRWRMPEVLTVSSILGLLAVVQSFGLFLAGIEALEHPHVQGLLVLSSRDGLRSVMFLQLVAGGHLLLFVTRSQGAFWKPSHPSLVLLGAIVATQVLAVPMCAFGWLLTPLSWRLIGTVWLYNLLWLLVLDVAKRAASGIATGRTRDRIRHEGMVTRRLSPHVEAS